MIGMGQKRLPEGYYSILVLYCVLLLFLFPSIGQAANQSENVKVLINRIAAAYGGKETIETVRSVIARGKIEAVVFDDKGTYVRYFKQGRKLRVNITYTRSKEERILDGNKGYESTDAGFSEVSGARYLAMLYQYKQLDLPCGLLKGEYQLTYEGKADVNGVNTEVIGLRDAEGPPIRIYVDMKRFFIIKVSGLFSMGANTMELSAEFSDFRQVQGTMQPYRITNYAGGQKIAEITLHDYELNTNINESLFRPD